MMRVTAGPDVRDQGVSGRAGWGVGQAGVGVGALAITGRFRTKPYLNSSFQFSPPRPFAFQFQELFVTGAFRCVIIIAHFSVGRSIF